MEKEEIIKEFIEKYRPYFVKFLTPEKETELYGSIRSSLAQVRQETIKEAIESFEGIKNMDRKMLSLKEIIEILQTLNQEK